MWYYISDKNLIPYFYGASWYVVSSVQRLLFGVIELWFFMKIFKKERWTEVLYFKNFKNGLIAGSVMFLIILFEIVTYFVIGAKSWIDTTVLTRSVLSVLSANHNRILGRIDFPGFCY